MGAYGLIEAKATELGWPTRFQADLTTHDKAALDGASRPEFLWAVYDSGTHLLRKDDIASLMAAGWSNVGASWRDILTGRSFEGARVYYSDGAGTLQEVTGKTEKVMGIIRQWAQSATTSSSVVARFM